MLIPEPPRPHRGEPILPMINVVFLLLIFFLISAELAPPEPFPVDVPSAEREDPAEGELTLFLDAGGQLGFRDATGEAAVLAALQAAVQDICGADGCSDEARPRVRLRADRAVEAATVAALLPRLGAIGVHDVLMITALR
ncbi:biopolymer transporter ExbD [Tropicimonas sp. IMCC34043]|uniref:ExbD/TolR family protein n=1 Tax=Tropicimonas sp. IMCC34043 TaxID=2248760 RepID=UPI000E2758C7|nr:biopolymer transporter ExbD [Tropicimonas sp. IMCC34043]